MKLSGSRHLTYCTNIHPGESLAEVRANVEKYVTRVKALVSPAAPFGVGLRLSARAARELETAGALAEFRDDLRARGLYVFTINGFPYGEFHSGPVKEKVYLPDWRSDDRLEYTNRLASLLAALLPDEEGLEGSVSTSPGAFKAEVRSESDVAAIADGMIRHAAFLDELFESTGKLVSLAVEPEPACLLETIEETVAFFLGRLFSAAACRRFAELRKVSLARAEAAVRRHLGVCFDACHMAVEFEDPTSSLSRLRSAGIRIGKVQISAGLETDGAPGELSRFDDGIYLHQVVKKSESGLLRYLDLPEALKAPPSPGISRVHFHVPIFRETLGPFRSTQGYLERVLAGLDESSRHLEVETYTFGVLPPEYRDESIVDAVSREISWVLPRVSVAPLR